MKTNSMQNAYPCLKCIWLQDLFGFIGYKNIFVNFVLT